MEDKTMIKLPDGVTMEQLKSNWDMALKEYTKPFRRIRLLDAADRSKLWEAVGAKFPSYQILPDTNHVSYVKNNLVASLYSVTKNADLIATTPEDKETVQHINMALEHQWGLNKVGYYQLQAGERAALTNLGITQVGWDNKVSGAGNPLNKGTVVYKNIDPTQFMRDPYAVSLDTSSFAIVYDDLHKDVLKSNPLYKDTLDKAIEALKVSVEAKPVTLHTDKGSSQGVKNYYRLIIHWVRKGDIYHEIHTLDNKELLHVIEDIQPAAFPFAMLHCNLPAGDLIGTSEPAKIFSNSVAYNLLSSLMLTAEYKNQRPPKYVSGDSGINLASFIKYGNEADYTFMVNGDASKAVHYHQFPSPGPQADSLLNRLSMDVQQITGVDGKYTGKDTGSILTTGGMEAMLDQATLIDVPKILLYEEYTHRLTQLTVDIMRSNSQKRYYFVKHPETHKFNDVVIDFPAIDKKTLFNYSIEISTMLPKNRARIAQTANVLMEKQMQYSQTGQKVDLITPEEWLMLQDLPIKEYMQDRMGIQRSQDYMEQVAKIMFTFTNLAQAGVAPDEALARTAEMLQQDQMPGGEPMPMQMPMDPMAEQEEFEEEDLTY